jgi:hypothetical protein
MSTLFTPAPVVNWRILPNIVIGGQGNGQADYQHLWYTIIQILTNNLYSTNWLLMNGASGSAPTACSVLLSCDGTTAPASQSDTTDRITAANKIVWNSVGNAHSWMLLSHPTNASGQLLIDFASLSAFYSAMGSVIETGAQPTAAGGIFYSHSGGFNVAGQYGIVSRRAWTADEVQIFCRRTPTGTYTTYLAGLSNSTTTGDWSAKLHVMRSSDGSSTRMVLCQNGVPIWYFFLEPPAAPFHTNATPDHIWNVDDCPWFGACYGSASAVSAGLYNGTSAWATAINFITRLSSNLNPTLKPACNLYPVYPYSAAWGDMLIVANNTTNNQGDGGYVPVSIGLTCAVSGYQQPQVGSINDLYFVGNNLTDGASGSDDGTNSWRKFGNFLMPWAHGVTALMS